MKNYKLYTVEGVRDFLPKEQKQKNEIKQRINNVFYKYAYEPIKTPTFEYVEVFAEEDGNISRKEMYKFLDRKGNVLALRPDLTPPIARVVATSLKEDVFPLRLSYMGNAYRHLEGYQGKLHEFTQAGVELIGDNSIASDAEVIAVAANSLLESGINDFVIHIGQVEFYKSIIEEAKIDPKTERRIRSLIENKNIVALENLMEENNINSKLSKLLLELPKLCGDISVIARAKKLTSNKKALDSLKNLEEIYETLKDYNVAEGISFDLGMLSRLDYYTGIIFKAYAYGSGAEILGGGRYDGLTEKFGKKLPATGFGININELLEAINKQEISLDTWSTETLVMYTKEGRSMAIATSEELRRTGLYLENSLLGTDVDTNVAYAKSKGIGGILFFKDEENVDLINLKTNERVTTKISEMLKG